MTELYEYLKHCRMKRHWTRGFTGFAWLWLAYLTADDISTIDPSFLDSGVWAVGATVIGTLTLLHWAVGGFSLRYAITFATLVYAISRGWSYLAVGIWAPFAIWMIVLGLTLSAYRATLRGGLESD